MVDSLADVLDRRFADGGNRALAIALSTLAVIALFPLVGPVFKADAHVLGQALPALMGLVHF